MVVKQKPWWQVWGIAVLLTGIGWLTACSQSQPAKFNTWLLVRAPDGPLPVGQPVEVRSRSEDIQNGVSHIELYLVEFQADGGSAVNNILIRSDAAPFNQTSFTASQVFIPKQKGRYAIKVVGYNKQGQASESDVISFVAQ